jgi:hypothetical protein
MSLPLEALTPCPACGGYRTRALDGTVAGIHREDCPYLTDGLGLPVTLHIGRDLFPLGTVRFEPGEQDDRRTWLPRFLRCLADAIDTETRRQDDATT